MNSELIDGWEKIIGHDRMKIISDKFFDTMLNLEFPNLQKGNYEHKKLKIHSELENIAYMLKEFETKGFLTHDEVSGMIDVLTQKIISKTLPDPLLENISLIIDDEILKNIKINLIEIERRDFLTHDEVSRIVKVLNQNIMHKIMSRPLFKYVCILMDDEKFKDHGENEWLENLTGYIRWGLEEEEKIMEEMKNKNKLLE